MVEAIEYYGMRSLTHLSQNKSMNLFISSPTMNLFISSPTVNLFISSPTVNLKLVLRPNVHSPAGDDGHYEDQFISHPLEDVAVVIRPLIRPPLVNCGGAGRYAAEAKAKGDLGGDGVGLVV